MPVLPEVGSIMTELGFSRPRASPSSIMALAMRSFHGTGRVKIFQLGKDAGLQPVFPFNGTAPTAVLPDQLVSGCIDTAHKNFLP